MRFATHYPEEGKLVLSQKHGGIVTVLEILEELFNPHQTVLKARQLWGQRAVLVKRGVKAPALPPPKEPKPVETDEQFLNRFPKGMWPGMKAAAKRNGVGVQDIFDNYIRTADRSHLVSVNEGWEIYSINEEPAMGAFRVYKIAEAKAFFLTIRKEK
jgi:hypothetical protein